MVLMLLGKIIAELMESLYFGQDSSWNEYVDIIVYFNDEWFMNEYNLYNLLNTNSFFIIQIHNLWPLQLCKNCTAYFISWIM